MGVEYPPKAPLSAPAWGRGSLWVEEYKRRKKPFISRRTVVAKFPWRTQNKALRSAHGRNHRKPHGTEPLKYHYTEDKIITAPKIEEPIEEAPF